MAGPSQLMVQRGRACCVSLGPQWASNTVVVLAGELRERAGIQMGLGGRVAQ